MLKSLAALFGQQIRLVPSRELHFGPEWITRILGQVAMHLVEVDILTKLTMAHWDRSDRQQ